MAVNATALRLLLERLVDELDELERIVWAEPRFVTLSVTGRPLRKALRNTPPEREELRRRISDSMMLACAALDGLTEV